MRTNAHAAGAVSLTFARHFVLRLGERVA